jgi:hypothetical protein
MFVNPASPEKTEKRPTTDQVPIRHGTSSHLKRRNRKRLQLKDPEMLLNRSFDKVVPITALIRALQPIAKTCKEPMKLSDYIGKMLQRKPSVPQSTERAFE